jgi:Skp family chaperone for outer membrane proteins
MCQKNYQKVGQKEKKLSRNCQKIKKIVRKLSKSFQKIVKKLSKSCQKSYQKSCQKLSKSCQKVVKKLQNLVMGVTLVTYDTFVPNIIVMCHWSPNVTQETSYN